jgi:hypothetical protein
MQGIDILFTSNESLQEVQLSLNVAAGMPQHRRALIRTFCRQNLTDPFLVKTRGNSILAPNVTLPCDFL